MGRYSRCACVLNPSKLEVGYQLIAGLDGLGRGFATHGVRIMGCSRV